MNDCVNNKIQKIDVTRRKNGLTSYRVQRRTPLLRLVELEIERRNVLSSLVRAELQDSVTATLLALNARIRKRFFLFVNFDSRECFFSYFQSYKAGNVHPTTY